MSEERSVAIGPPGYEYEVVRIRPGLRPKELPDTFRICFQPTPFPQPVTFSNGKFFKNTYTEWDYDTQDVASVGDYLAVSYKTWGVQVMSREDVAYIYLAGRKYHAAA